ncbi:MAG TPA: CHAT domain-containing protein, partial [Polyangiaceae bacterium]
MSQLMRPSPALSEALAREAPAIKAAALLRNSRATEAKGEQQARAIANRIHQALGAEVPEQVVLVQVMNAVAREQMAAAFGQGGPLGAILRTQAAHAGGPLADALNQLGTVDLKAMGEAFRKAYNGQEPAEAARHFRAEFERSEAICRIQAFQSAERSALYQSALRSENALLDAVLTLLDRNPKSAELCRLGYEMAVAYKARSPEVERRISAALAESKSAEARAAREQWRAARESVASLELQLAAGVALDERQRSELSRAQSEERRLVQRLSELARLGRNQDKPFHAADGIEQLKQRLGADEAVLSFVEYRQVKPDDTAAPPPGQGAYCAFVLTRTGLSSVSVGSGESLQQGVEGFLHAVGSAATSIEQKQEVSNHLYERLLAPLEAALSRSPKVQIVPDGVLQLLPFDALYDGKAWLADRYQLSYAFRERQLLGEPAPPLGFGPP